MTSIGIIGATGFVGRHIVDRLSQNESARLRLLARSKDQVFPAPDRLQFRMGDLRDMASVNEFLRGLDILVNAANLKEAEREANLSVAANLARACREAGVSRVIHLSTAVVAGRTREKTITELTTCKPFTLYEKTKFEMEKVFLEKLGKGVDCIILRPTAVFGPGGKNLIKLVNDLTRKHPAVNRLRSFLFGDRRMNLVGVDNLAAAVEFFIKTGIREKPEIFIVSDDEFETNNFRFVESFLANKLGLGNRRPPRIVAPKSFLAAVLRLAGRGATDPDRRYSCRKLLTAGFVKPFTFEQGLERFTNQFGGGEKAVPASS